MTTSATLRFAFISAPASASPFALLRRTALTARPPSAAASAAVRQRHSFFLPPSRPASLSSSSSFSSSSSSSSSSSPSSLPLRRPRSRTFSAPTASAAMPDSSSAAVATTAAPSAPPVKYLRDYAPPPYTILSARLHFSLDDDGLNTVVSSRLTMRRAPSGGDPAAAAAAAPPPPLVLDGEGLQLEPGSLKIGGAALPDGAFAHDPAAHTLTVAPAHVPADGAEFELETVVRIRPAKNTELHGLYMSNGDYCTQCEPEGFRRITFFIDRPDVMARFNVRVEGDKRKHPVLLSNGNCVSRGDAPDGRHWAEFEDRFPKPCYLFALVAGDLDSLDDSFTTVGGREVALKVFVKGADEVRKCRHAMDSLKKAMKWDEDVYGLEYNYDVFNIVAVPSFVFGAMENTSLNIFNSKYVLVSPETATDRDFNNVEGVVAHEYFHNYSGNRVTVSSWFQLSLKEGLTVFRDKCFSADMNSAAVNRINTVSYLRSVQFAEDAGPMSHPIRPESYITCNTFYTPTVYEKGAEVIRMTKTLVGPEGYRRGTDIYFSRNDGKAVTCEDWVQAIQDANPDVDLTVFRRWYSQSGTPVVTVEVSHDAATSTMTLNCHQQIPPTQKQPTTEPMLIPLAVGIIAADGTPVPVDLQDGREPVLTRVLNFETREAAFKLHNVPAGAVPSLLREFSAPVKLVRKGGVSDDELAFMMANDTDEFNKWQCSQELIVNFALECLKVGDPAALPYLPTTIIEAFRKTLTNESVDTALRAQVFSMPSETYMLEQVKAADPVRIRSALKHIKRQLAENLEEELKSIVEAGQEDAGEYKLDPVSQGNRALRNAALSFLSALEKKETYEKCLETVRQGSNMTDVLSALMCLASSKTEESEIALNEFYKKWESDYLVVDKWLQIQSTSRRDDVLDVVKQLTQHPSYKETVPNSVYALIGGYGSANVHIPTDGSGYKFMADQVMHMDKLNPQVAARLAKPFTFWRKFEEKRQEQMHAELERIKAMEGLSKDVFEVVNNCLADA